MKVAFTILACLSPVLGIANTTNSHVSWADEHNQYYSDYIRHALDVADKYLAEGNLDCAKIQYEEAHERLKLLSKRDTEHELRITFSKLIMKIIVDKDKDAVKDFVKAVLSHVEYKDGKIIVDLDVLVF